MPADQATAPEGPTATWSIQRRLASVATVSLSPLASVDTTLPSSPPVTTRPPSLADDRTAPPWTANALRLAVARRQQQRLLAEDEERGLLQEMQADDRRVGLHRPHALDD